MMTFVTNPRDYHHYFTTTTTDFQAAVQPFTMRAGTSLHSTCVCVCVCGWVWVCVCVCGLRCSYNLIVTHVWNNILFYKRLSFLILILGTHTALQVTRSVYILVPDPPLPTHTHHTTQPVCLVCSHLTRPLHTHTHTHTHSWCACPVLLQASQCYTRHHQGSTHTFLSHVNVSLSLCRVQQQSELPRKQRRGGADGFREGPDVWGRR